MYSRLKFSLILLVLISTSFVILDALDQEVFHWSRRWSFAPRVLVDWVNVTSKILPGVLMALYFVNRI